MKKPIAQKQMTRLLVLIIIVLALAAGYYYTVYGYEKRKYQRLLDKYETLVELENNSD